MCVWRSVGKCREVLKVWVVSSHQYRALEAMNTPPQQDVSQYCKCVLSSRFPFWHYHKQNTTRLEHGDKVLSQAVLESHHSVCTLCMCCLMASPHQDPMLTCTWVTKEPSQNASRFVRKGAVPRSMTTSFSTT